MLGDIRDRAPIHVTSGFPPDDCDRLIEAARIRTERGVGRLKMVVDVHEKGWAEDARGMRGVRRAIGNDVELTIDAN